MIRRLQVGLYMSNDSSNESLALVTKREMVDRRHSIVVMGIGPHP